MSRNSSQGSCSRRACAPLRLVQILLVLNVILFAATGACFWWLSWLTLQHHQVSNAFNPFGHLTYGKAPKKLLPFVPGPRKRTNFLQRSHCSNIVRGPIPTTLPTKKNATCTWQKSSSKNFSHFAGSTLETSIEDAKHECIQLGNLCRGISCRGEKCLAMMGQLIRNNKTTSFLKMCLYSGEALEDTILPAASSNSTIVDAAVVVLAHNRQSDLAACLDSLLQLEDMKLFKIFVSLDDDRAYPEMRSAVIELSQRYQQKNVVWTVSERKVEASDNKEQQKWFKTSTGKIAHHYWTVFERAFMGQQHDMVIFLEEDLIVAPDFLTLFRSTAWLLREDPSIWCVSAWNDVGFALSASDQCRLFRTTYFPGLGFMLPRHVWLQLREEWPSAPTMGWDYWMRTAFRRADKECIVPEVPRSRHESRKGSSIVTHKQVRFFELFAFAELASACDSTEPCNQFGDISYLLRTKYEFWMRTALTKGETMRGESQLVRNGYECRSEAIDLGPQKSTQDCALLVGMGDCSQYFGFPKQNSHWGCRCCRGLELVGKEHSHWSIYSAERTGDPGKLYVYPYKWEEYSRIAMSFGLQPEGMEHMIPQDVRAEHYGLVVGRHLTSGAVVLLVDKRSSKQYLPPDQRLTRSLKLAPVAGRQGMSCEESCKEDEMACDADQFHFLNDCHILTSSFGCNFCAHQAGLELPAYVVDNLEPTVGQCLVTYISPFHCATKHPSTRRLCPCMPIPGSEQLLV